MTIAGRRQAGAKPPSISPLGLRFHRRFFILPLPSEGGIGKDIIEGLPLKLVIGQGVAVLDEV